MSAGYAGQVPHPRGERVDLSRYQYQVLHLLVVRAGEVPSKEALISAGWSDMAVGDDSLAKTISQLHRRLDADDPEGYVRAVSRHGYQFVATVTPVRNQEAGLDLELLLAPHRAWTEGRAALESLRCDRIAAARVPCHPMAHAGLTIVDDRPLSALPSRSRRNLSI